MSIFHIILSLYLASSVGVVLFFAVPRSPKPIGGQKEFTGSVTATLDSLDNPQFAYAFAEATSDFDDWFLTGYRRALK